MADVLTPDRRRHYISRVRNKDTDIERESRKALCARSLRYRLASKLPDKPDLCFVIPKVAVFVDGSLWHCCPTHGQVPATNEAFSNEKIASNIARDSLDEVMLSNAGWHVVESSPHDVKKDAQGWVYRVIATFTKQTATRP